MYMYYIIIINLCIILLYSTIYIGVGVRRLEWGDGDDIYAPRP